MTERMSAVIKDKLARFSEYMVSMDVHFTDESGRASSTEVDKRCVLKANMKGGAAEVVTGNASTLDFALNDAIGKMRNALDARTGKMKRH